MSVAAAETEEQTANAGGTAQKIPWPTLVAALMSLIAFALCFGGTILSIVLAIAILFSYTTDARLRQGSLPLRTLRLLVMGAQVMIRLGSGERQSSYALLDMYIELFGQLTATEMALQFWQSPSYGGPGGAAVLSLSGLVLMSAAKTDQPGGPVKYLVPIYIFFLMLGLHRARDRRAGGKKGGWMPTALAMVLALGVGFGTSTAIWAWHNELTVWFTRLMPPLGKSEGTGISQIPVLGATSNLKLSSARVLRIDGPLAQPYLRGLAYDTYGHGVWGPPLDARHFEALPTPELQRGPVLSRVQITRLTNDSRLLVAPLDCSGVQLPRHAVEMARDDGGPLRSTLWIPAPSTHIVLLPGEPDFQGPLCQPISADYRRRCLALPDGFDKRVIALANQVAGSAATQRERAAAIVDYLRTHNEYSTTTNPGKGDPVTGFILEHRAAHCEYFASAAVLMLRAVKLPARYVTGYAAFASVGKEQSIIRQRDAHAWAECWLDGTGWVTLDATPDSGLPNEEHDPVPWFERLSEWAEDLWGSVRDWLSEVTATQQMTAVLSLLVMVLGLQWLRMLRSRKKIQRIVFTYAPPGAELAALGEQFERFLKAHQIACPAHRTWLEHLNALAQARPPLPFNPEAAAAFAQRYAEVRFGNPESREAVEELARELGALRGKS